MRINSIKLNTYNSPVNFKSRKSNEDSSYWGDLMVYSNVLAFKGSNGIFPFKKGPQTLKNTKSVISNPIKTLDYDIYESIYKY